MQIVDYTDIPRFTKLDVVGVPQPFWHVKGEYFWELEAKYLGRERAEKEYPMKSFQDAGVTLASASDYPVQVPSPPLVGIMLGILRCIPGDPDPNEIPVLPPGCRPCLTGRKQGWVTVLGSAENKASE